MKNIDTVWIILLSMGQLNWMNMAPIPDDAILSVTERIVATVNDETVEIVKKNEQIEYMVEAAKDSIENSLGNLVQFIKESKLIADSEGVNISSCISRTIVVDQIDVNEIEKCSYQEELQGLQEQLFDIGNRTIALTEQTEDGLSEDDDVNSLISDIENELSSLQSKVKEFLSEAYSTALHCTEAHLASLDQKINLISEDFTSCLEAFEGL